jgi:hypothetical protein
VRSDVDIVLQRDAVQCAGLVVPQYRDDENYRFIFQQFTVVPTGGVVEGRLQVIRACELLWHCQRRIMLARACTAVRTSGAALAARSGVRAMSAETSSFELGTPFVSHSETGLRQFGILA